MHDLVIRGGLVVDGTGAPTRRIDVAIDGGRIAELGERLEGVSEIDASGCIVTPGFVDIHTHLDAQVGWDSALTPCAWHGVTTVLIGNCGVTFAPVRPGSQQQLAEMMESVEDIPRDAILSGMRWDWETYGQYLDSLERSPIGLNVAGLVGHSAVRMYVMGDRGVDGEATPSDLGEMARVVRESVEAGAIGFSTSRYLHHRLPDGRCVPGTHAAHSELLRIADAIGEAGGGLFQNVLNTEERGRDSMELLREEAARCGRAIFSTGVDGDPASGARMRSYFESALGGHNVTAMVIPRGSGALSGLVGTLPYQSGDAIAEFMANMPTWHALSESRFDLRRAMVDDPRMYDWLVAEAKSASRQPRFDQYFPLGDGPSPEYLGETSLAEIAARSGVHPAETWLEMTAQSRGTALFLVRFLNRSVEALVELMRSDLVLPGLGDAGAHVGQVMDAGWTSFMLSHWVRDTRTFGLEDTIHRMTARPSDILGFEDRGRLLPGFRADVNVIDLDRLSLAMPTMVDDFPGGASRLVQRATGYRATLVNGTLTLVDDELTGNLPGKVLRSR